MNPLSLTLALSLAPLAAASATTPLGQEAALAHDSSAVEVQAALADLRTQVAELRAEANGSGEWLTASRAAEIRALVQDVLGDASARASLAADGGGAGFKDTLWIASADGNFRLNMRGYTQIRFTYDHRSEVTGVANATNNEWGWEMRRTKLYFEGFAGNPSWKYKTELSFAPGSATPTLEDAYIEKVLSDGFLVRAGQFKAPFNREFLLSDTSTVFADRSSIASFFSPGRTQGAQVAWMGDAFRVYGMFANGFEVKSNYISNGSLLNQSWNSTKVAQYAFIGRGEWRVAGTWEQFANYTGWRGQEFGALVGLAGEVMKRGNSQGVPVALGNLNPMVSSVTTDVTLQFDGASLNTWFVYRQVNPDSAGLAAANQYGVVVQGGLFVTDEVELIGRYEYGSADTMPNGEAPVVTAMPSSNGYSVFNAVSVGFNYFVAKQRVRFTADALYAFDGVGAFASSATNFARDGTNSAGDFSAKGQVVLRMQMQLMF